MSDAAPYRIFGIELSPYSVKVRSYFRYKGIPHTWVVRGASQMDEFRRYAKLPLVPLVVGADGSSLQDSTPILERMEDRYPEPGIHPPDPVAAFVSALIEEYADEWGNKPMFHFRWTYEADQQSAAERIARANVPDAPAAQLGALSGAIRERMVPRLSFVGSSDATRDTIEGSFRRQAEILEAHLARRPYLFGARPAFADFGAYAQLYQCWSDPTPGAWLRTEAPRVVDWIQRMLAPKAEGPFEPWSALEPTLVPLLREEVAGLLPALVGCERPRARRRRSGVRSRARRPAVPPAGAEVPRALARRAARAVRRGRGRRRARRAARAHRVSPVARCDLSW